MPCGAAVSGRCGLPIYSCADSLRGLGPRSPAVTSRESRTRAASSGGSFRELRARPDVPPGVCFANHGLGPAEIELDCRTKRAEPSISRSTPRGGWRLKNHFGHHVSHGRVAPERPTGGSGSRGKQQKTAVFLVVARLPETSFATLSPFRATVRLRCVLPDRIFNRHQGRPVGCDGVYATCRGCAVFLARRETKDARRHFTPHLRSHPRSRPTAPRSPRPAAPESRNPPPATPAGSRGRTAEPPPHSHHPHPARDRRRTPG